MDNKHRYVVECRRKVNFPAGGPQCHYVDVRHREFVYGKGKPFGTGKKAYAAACEFMARVSDQFSEVSTVAWVGFGGSVVWREDRPDKRWEHEHHIPKEMFQTWAGYPEQKVELQ